MRNGNASITRCDTEVRSFFRKANGERLVFYASEKKELRGSKLSLPEYSKKEYL